MDKSRIHPHHHDDDDLALHHSCLERLERLEALAVLKAPVCTACFGGYVTITVEEDGQEHDEAVPCRRCGQREDG